MFLGTPFFVIISLLLFKIIDGDTYRLVCNWAEDGYPPQRKLGRIENFRGRYISLGLWLGGEWISSAASSQRKREALIFNLDEFCLDLGFLGGRKGF